MAVLAFGEGYHNYHHSFPFDYRNGIKRWHFDPAKWTIYGLSIVGLAGDLRRASDAVILKARIDVQFERAKERLERLQKNRRVLAEARESVELRLHETYARLQAALRELVAAQRQRRPAVSKPVLEAKASLAQAVTPAAAETPEGRLGTIQHALEQALWDWKQALRQMKRLPAAAVAA
jgi:stearoyl-CoA desaturase (delta-9 desaturase)